MFENAFHLKAYTVFNITNHCKRIGCVGRSFVIRRVISAQHKTDGQTKICAKDMDEHGRSDIRNLTQLNSFKAMINSSRTISIYFEGL